MSDAMKLTPDQQAALDAISAWRTAPIRTNSPTAVLTGNAGTGKTTLMRVVVETAIEAGAHVAVTAPTHKALNVLRDKLGANAKGEDAPVFLPTFSTIQSLLGYRMDEQDDGTLHGKFGVGTENIRDFEFVVVDECSMLDRDLLAFLGKVRPYECRVLFVGDPAQLPPVSEEGDEAGLSPVFEIVDTQFRLTQIVRQAADNPIIRIATGIRESQASLNRCTIHEIAALAANSDGRAGLMAHNFDSIVRAVADEIRAGVDARVLCFTNKRVLSYNEAIHAELHGVHTKSRFAVSERVIVQETGSALDDTALDTRGRPTKRALQTNEELTVIERMAVNEPMHPDFPDLPAQQYKLQRATGEEVRAIVATDPQALDNYIGSLFAEARALKGAKNFSEGKKRAGEAWAVKKAFLNLRHAYAITSHKSQGSTFHTVFVDFPDMTRIRDAATFNRALYVAVTRASTHLAIAA
jgi:exodeoxyribonuclease-5